MQKESVNFGIYSCDWTKMDIKFKKLLLLTMKLNNADKLKIKATPNKVVNLQLFSSVIILYNYIYIKTYYIKILIDTLLYITSGTNINLISGDDHNLQHCHGHAQNNEREKLILVLM